MIHTTNDGCRLSLSVAGPAAAPPLLLVNSLGTDVELWSRQVPRFANTCQVWRSDMRGHGLSDAPRGDYSLARLAEDLLSIMDAHGLARAHLCGISIGGLVALWIACNVPERVERLVLANTAARIGHDDLWNERIRVARSEGLEPLADAAMGRWFTEPFRRREPATVAAFHDTLARTSVDGYVGCCAALRDADLRVAAGGVRARTLVIIALQDVATPAADGRWLSETIAGAELVELEAAHLSNVERADAFNDAVLTFLQV